MSVDDTIRQVVREELREFLRLFREAQSQQKEGTELLSIAQCVALTGLGAGTIRKWRTDGKLTHYGSGRTIRIDKAELLRLMRRRDDAAAPTDADIENKADRLLGRGH